MTKVVKVESDADRQAAFAQHIVMAAVGTVTKNYPADSFMAWWSGTVASVVGNLSDDYWEACKKCIEKPCGRPGCDCHLVLKPKTIELLSMLRADYQKTIAQREKEKEKQATAP